MTPNEEVEETIALKRQETERIQTRTTKHHPSLHTHTEIKLKTITTSKEKQ